MRSYTIRTSVLIDVDGTIENRKEIGLSRRYDADELRSVAGSPQLLFQMMGKKVGQQFEQALGKALIDADQQPK